jgi:hypothetical protein
VRERLHAYEDAICAMCHPREPINFHQTWPVSPME